MASQVLSGATNASYTNNTGQNVRLLINYMANVTSMTWAGVTVSASARTIGKNVPITYTTNDVRINLPILSSVASFLSPGTISSTNVNVYGSIGSSGTISGGRAISVAPTTLTGSLSLIPSTNSNFPIELMLAPNQSFSAVCGAYNAIIIKEDGT